MLNNKKNSPMSNNSHPSADAKSATLGIRCTNGQFFMPGKVLNTIYFLKGNNADSSNLILLGLEKQRVITFEA